MNSRSELPRPSRRDAITGLAAGMAALVSSCSPMGERKKFISRAAPLMPDDAYAALITVAGFAQPALAMMRDGRPIKLDGNPEHPAFAGGSTAFTQAAILDLYDPQRARTPRDHTGIISLDAVDRMLEERLAHAVDTRGEGLALLTGRITSPTNLQLIERARLRFPLMRWHRWEPLHDDMAQAGNELAFERRADTHADLASAGAILVLEADPLGPGPDQVRLSRGFAAARLRSPPAPLHVIESSLTSTGVSADRRTAAHPAEISTIIASIAVELGAPGNAPPIPEHMQQAAGAALRMLRSTPRPLVLPGASLSPQDHAACIWINQRFGAPVTYLAAIDPHPQQNAHSINELRAALEADAVDTLLVLDCNPAYSAPDPAGMSAALKRAGFIMHGSAFFDETSRFADVHVPLSHPLECWSDARSTEGHACIGQPLVHPLFASRSVGQMLARIAGVPEAETDRECMETAWRERVGVDIASTLARGFAEDPAKQITVAPRAPTFHASEAPIGWTLSLSPSASTWDGSLAHNAWLQECPAPVSKETWGASVTISGADAAKANWRPGDVVRISSDSRLIKAPVRVCPHQAEGVLTLPLGYGRTHSGPIADHIGPNAAIVRDRDANMLVAGVAVEGAGENVRVPNTQNAFRIEGQLAELFPLATLPNSPLSDAHDGEGLITPIASPDRAWAMVIDAAACVGCNACVIACQAENNLAVIGPEEVLRQRDMHWMRIDRHDGVGERPGGFQPVPCMHCEQAPCEPVCPVEASVHDHEGLNLQVYNRCIGTRFCQANCPYKVRRFNYHDYFEGKPYDGLDSSSLEAVRNPEVTVRTRGVMEKCTYCVQRIAAARSRSARDDAPIRDGEVVTACQAACPTQAIHFGDRNDSSSDVARLQEHPRRYDLLGRLGTKPRTSYLARLHVGEDAS